jgi:hypothetical protein
LNAHPVLIVGAVNTETVARILAAISTNNDLLTVRAAEAAGINRVVLKRAADAGLILRPARGKYAALGAPPRELQFKGVQLGTDGVLSHRGGLYFWGLDGVDELILEWSIPHSTRVNLGNVYRRRNFDRLEVVESNGVLVTSVRQTLLDVAWTCDRDLVERALESALRKGFVRDDEMREFAARQRYAPGGPALRAVLALRPPGARPTGSDLETLCLQVYRRGGLFPERQWEVRTNEGEVLGYGDFGFPPKAFISEVDGMATHGPEAAQYDYTRQARMEDLGYRFRRFTRSDVLYRPKHLCDVTRRGIVQAPYL